MKTIEKKFLLPFCLVTVLFLLWGIANNMTDTLLSAFKRIMSMSDTQTSLIQFAFYGSYFCFALPAALYIRKFSYKSGVILGLGLYAAGAILFFPAAKVASYGFYLAAIYILAGGCSILETTANPYILSMGAPETATRRLNIAQSFNPLGSITGILLSQYFILGELSSASAAERAAMSPEQLEAMQAHELGAVTGTYMTLGFVLLAILVVMLLVKMPEGGDSGQGERLGTIFRRLFANKTYAGGVVAQFFYVGAQIGVWSFTIRLVMQELGILEAKAASIYLASIICFSAARAGFPLQGYRLAVRDRADRGQLLHEPDVPDHLRHCAGRSGGERRQNRRQWPDNGHLRRRAADSAAGQGVRPVRGERVLSGAARLLHCGPALRQDGCS